MDPEKAIAQCGELNPIILTAVYESIDKLINDFAKIVASS